MSEKFEFDWDKLVEIVETGEYNLTSEEVINLLPRLLTLNRNRDTLAYKQMCRTYGNLSKDQPYLIYFIDKIIPDMINNKEEGGQTFVALLRAVAGWKSKSERLLDAIFAGLDETNTPNEIDA